MYLGIESLSFLFFTEESEQMRRDMIRKMEERLKASAISPTEKDVTVAATELETVPDKQEPVALLDKEESPTVAELETQSQNSSENGKENVKSINNGGKTEVQVEVCFELHSHN